MTNLRISKPLHVVSCTLERLILKSHLSPGDIVMLTAAVRDLHHAYPGRFQTDVRTTAPWLWENNPYITPLDENDPEVRVIECHYPLINRSNTTPYHFIHGYAQYLEEQLKLRIPVREFKGDIHLSREERGWMSQVEETGFQGNFWIVMAGGKYDFTAKWWDPAGYQQVVDHFRGRIQFVQCGEASHFHPKLKGVIDLIGQTDIRQFVRLVHHADGVLCPVTFAMHLAAAVPTKPGKPRNRACVVLAGGREPAQWEAYPHHRFLSTNGALPCCDQGGCWRSRCQRVGDGDPKDRNPTQANHSSEGNPHPILHFDVGLPGASFTGYFTSELSVSGGSVGAAKTYTIQSGQAGKSVRMASQFDASAYPTGFHDFEMKLTARAADGTLLKSQSVIDRVAVVNRIDSEYGNRWWLPFLDRLDVDEATTGGVGLIRGDGTADFFTGTGGTYSAPSDIFETLTKTATGKSSVCSQVTAVEMGCSRSHWWACGEIGPCSATKSRRSVPW